MAGSSLTYAVSRGNRNRTITIDWVSDDATGAVTGNTRAVVGRLVKAVTIPSVGGTAPTADYDIDLLDANDASLFTGAPGAGALANRSATAIETVIPDYDVPLDDVITISVANAGNAKEGQLILYIEGPDW